MASNRFESIAAKLTEKPIIVFLFLLLFVNIILFREMIFYGKVPVAFDYGVYNYQPWKLDFEKNFSQAPKKIGHDDIKIFYPQRKIITDSLRKGKILFWNPYAFAGNVAAANSQTAIFYPPFLLFLILPQAIAWSWLSFSVPILAGIGSFLYIRNILSNKYAAGFGALVFAFSSAIITRTQDGLVAGHSILWLPWVLYGIEKYLQKNKVSGLITILLTLVFSMLAGWFQFTFYVYAVSFFYALYIWFNKNKKQRHTSNWVILICIFLFSVLLAAFHWLPSMEALKFSPRGVFVTPSEFSIKHLMPLSHLVTLFIPNFFGHIANGTYYGASEFKEGIIAIGLIPVLLAILGIAKKTKNTHIKFFIIALLVSMFLGIQSPISRAIISIKIPILSTFLPNRIFTIASFSLAVLSALGLQELIRGRTSQLKKIIKIVLVLFLLFYFSIAVFYVYEKVFSSQIGFSMFEKGIERYIRISLKESIVPFALLFFLTLVLFKTKEKASKTLIFVIIIITLISQIYRANRYLYFSDTKHEFPENPITNILKQNSKEDKSRFLSLSYSRITSNIPTYFELYFPEGIDAMYPIWYGEFARFYEGKEIATDDVLRIETTFSEELERRRWNDPKTINLLSHLGVRYVVVPKDAYHIIPPEPAFEKVFAHKWHTVYEYKYAFPKAYFVPNSSFSNDKTLTLQRIFHPLFFNNPEVVLAREANLIGSKKKNQISEDISNIDLVKKHKKMLLLIKEDPFTLVRKAASDFTNNSVKLIEYRSSSLILEADVEANGFVVINDSYFPGWVAEVDGEETTLFRANHAFRAVPVTKGKHTIVLKYVSRYFRIALLISAIAAAMLLFMLSWYIKVNQENKHKQ